MKKMKIILNNSVLIAFMLAAFIACDEDFANLDSDVINPQTSTNFNTNNFSYPVVTYNKKINPFKSNGLPSYLLGYYNDAVFGTSKANFVAQMLPTQFNPTFGKSVELDSVVLTIPYFSRSTAEDNDGNITYEIDSILGNTPIKLSVYQNNFFLRNFDPNSEFDGPQKYYSNGVPISALELESQLLYQDSAFLPSNKQILLTELDENGQDSISGRIAPAIRIKLDNPNDDFWQKLFFDKEGESELKNSNNFLNHFRGLYFKAEAVNTDGAMMLLNFSSTDTNLTLYYTNDDDDDEDTPRKEDIFVLNFSGNLVNIFDNNFITIPEGDQENGDEKLYLKGGEGAMAVIDLFNGIIEDENGDLSPAFDAFKKSFRKQDKNGSFIEKDNGDFAMKRLINEAYLEFFVDQNSVQGQEPDRIYIFKLENNSPLIDYNLDQSVDDRPNFTKTKVRHLEPLTRVDNKPNGKGIKYRIRITEHLKDLIIRDSTNVKLGLVVTSNVESTALFTTLDEDDPLKNLTSGAILSPKGTVLYGNNTSENTKKVTLKIYYTEPEN